MIILKKNLKNINCENYLAAKTVNSTKREAKTFGVTETRVAKRVERSILKLSSVL